MQQSSRQLSNPFSKEQCSELMWSSIDIFTREERSIKKHLIRKNIKPGEVPLPESWSQFISSDENKENLTAFLSNYITKEVVEEQFELIASGGFKEGRNSYDPSRKTRTGSRYAVNYCGFYGHRRHRCSSSSYCPNSKSKLDGSKERGEMYPLHESFMRYVILTRVSCIDRVRLYFQLLKLWEENVLGVIYAAYQTPRSCWT